MVESEPWRCSGCTNDRCDKHWCVKFYEGQIETHTVIMRSATRTVRWIYAEHMDLSKFDRSQS